MCEERERNEVMEASALRYVSSGKENANLAVFEEGHGRSFVLSIASKHMPRAWAGMTRRGVVCNCVLTSVFCHAHHHHHHHRKGFEIISYCACMGQQSPLGFS